MSDEPEIPELKSAADNPWYVLMTVAGEQTGERILDIDWDLHARNQRYWNGWQAQALSDEQKKKLIEDDRASAKDLAPLTEEEEAKIAEALAERCPGAERPDPGDTLDLPGREVEGNLVCTGFVFSGDADFRNATFSGTAFFANATFSGDAHFENATFSGDAHFENATFSGDAFFGNATFSGGAFFGRGTFRRDADFSNATFAARTEFSEAKFLPPSASPPRFFGAEMHEDTVWTDVRWPNPPATRDHAVQFRSAYERLKLVMDGQKKTHEEHMFFRKEMQCREIEEAGSLNARASRAFGWIFRYGWDFKRPGILLGGTWVFGAALIGCAEWADYWLGAWPNCDSWADPLRECPRPEYLNWRQAIGLGFSNTFSFLGMSRNIMYDEVRSLTGFSEVVAGAQMFLGPVFLFLLALGLRNRFRIK